MTAAPNAPASAVPNERPMAGRVAVLHVVDTLAAGGAERMAVNLANALPRDRYEAHLCTTRAEGPLGALVRPDVGRLRLARARRFDAAALARLVGYVRRQRVRVLHAHGSSLYAALLAAAASRHATVVWHDHYGRDLRTRRVWPLRAAVTRARQVIVVSEPLARWAHERLGVGAGSVHYLPNFVAAPRPAPVPPSLPGTPGGRVVCVANFRPQKDHATLVRAFGEVVRRVPGAHLLLVGASGDADYERAVRAEISACRLDTSVSVLGERSDVAAVLAAADVGVLSSTSEGLPLALLEYGMAGLPAVATDVGQCGDVLDGGRAGVVVPPRDPGAIAAALVTLLGSPARRAELGAALRARVEAHHSEGACVAHVARVYESALGRAS